MLTFERLEEMLKLQEQLEVRISGPAWRAEEHNFALCIHMECAEILNHYGWKHWKDLDKQPDVDAIAMELVDIWHFVMAFMLTFDGFNAKQMHGQILEAIEEYEKEGAKGIVPLCIGMGYSMFAMNQFPYGNFIGVMHLIDMDFDDLQELYIAKNVLNRFRQDHDYKEGKYNKEWGGKEDNEHLQELIDGSKDILSAELLYDLLLARYTALSEI